ncbi:MAG: cell division protein FtsZ [SAR324 cluster bacterium]|nr:cell division protein FtsZ [SAR324 cluster bacterium]
MLGFSDIKRAQNDNPVIRVIGIGGGGGNAINRMVTMMDTQTVEFVAANTDLQDLRNSAATYKLQLGVNCTKGLGAGAKPQVGREAAIENSDLVREFVSGADMVFITAGMGGGTGTGGAPVVAQIARELEALTVGVVTLPFRFEGKQRRKNAEKGIQELKDHVDTLIVIPNDNLLSLVSKRTSMVEAFNLADDILRQAIQGISDLITNEGIINLDFADVRTVMQNGGKAVMGVGIATGENRATEAAKQAIHSPLLSDRKITGSQGILVNMVGGNTLTMHEVNEAACFIQEQAHEEATIIWGASIHPDQEDQIQITVIATGFGKDEAQNESKSNLEDNDVIETSLGPDSKEAQSPAFFLQNSTIADSSESASYSSQKAMEEQEVSGLEESSRSDVSQEVNESVFTGMKVEEQKEAVQLKQNSDEEEVEILEEKDIEDPATLMATEILQEETIYGQNNKLDEDSGAYEIQPEHEIKPSPAFTVAESAAEGSDFSYGKTVPPLSDLSATSQMIQSDTQKEEPPIESSLENDENVNFESIHDSALKETDEETENPTQSFVREEGSIYMDDLEEEGLLVKENADIAVETEPRYPDWAIRKRHRRDFTSDLDIPTFIRRRAKKLKTDFR